MLPADPAARAGSTPEASGDSSSGTFCKEMKAFLLLTLVSTLAPLLSAENITLQGRDYPEQKRGEGIMVWVREDRSLLADFGPVSVEKVIQTCKEWRKRGTEPGIRILLYTSLPSNKDLSCILELMKGLDENMVSFDIIIASEEAPPDDLFVNIK